MSKSIAPAGRVTITHEYYGCQCGCCGHEIRIDGEVYGRIHFSHPCGIGEREFGEELVRGALGEDRVKDINWEESQISDDCSDDE